MKGLSGQRIVTQDGKIALIVEVYFDDKGWQVRYLVVDTGNPMPRREVLVPRACIAAGQRHGDAIRIRLTRAQLEQCLEKDADPPVWYQRDLLRAANYSKAAVSDPHLRSSAIVIGYAAEAQDGRAGRVEDILIDGETWLIAHMAIDTRSWLPGRHVLVPPGAVERIDWATRELHLGLTRAEVRASPTA